jgi:bacterioferritin-associated ferredoxin
MLNMEKCHCVGIRFEKILEVSQKERCCFWEAAKKLDVSQTCTACKEDLESFYQKIFNLEKVAS